MMETTWKTPPASAAFLVGDDPMLKNRQFSIFDRPATRTIADLFSTTEEKQE